MPAEPPKTADALGFVQAAYHMVQSTFCSTFLDAAGIGVGHSSRWANPNTINILLDVP
jgi:hypothetical protein